MAKRKTRNIALFLVAIIVIAVLLTQVEQLPFSMVVNSITLSKVISNDSDLDNTFFVITTKLTGDSQKIVGTGELDAASNPVDFYTSFPVELKAGGVDETANFEIINENEPVYYFDIFERSRNWPWEPEPQCPDGYSQWEQRDITGVIRVLCVQQRTKGTKGYIENPSVAFDAVLTMKVNDWVDQKLVSNTDSTIEFYHPTLDYVGNASWTGSLITSDPLPNTSNLVAIYLNQDSKWHLQTADEWTQYLGVRSNALSAYNTPANYCYDGSCFQLIHNAISTNNNFDWGTDQTINGTIPNGTLISVALDRRVSVPEIVWKVRADVVGTVIVSISVGRPDILESSLNYSFESGNQEQTLNFSVKNTGDSVATFASSIDCTKFSTYSSFSSQQQFEAGQTKAFTLKILSGNQTNVTESCYLRVYDTSKPSNEDKIPITVNVSTPTFCGNNVREGTEQCDGTDLAGKTCENFGYTQGVLQCTPNCQFKTSGCSYDAPDPQQECLNKPGEFPFISGYTWVEVNSPVHLFGIDFLPVVGYETTASCQPVWNIAVIVLGIAAMFAVVLGIYVYRRR